MHGSAVSKCSRTWITTKQTLKCGTVITVKIIVTNGDVKLIDKNKIQRLLIGFFLCGVRLRELKNKEKG